jgi:serine phosphatase RsbU (regulator of sigma subunit)
MELLSNLLTAPVGAVVWRLGGEILGANRAFCELLGLEAGEGQDYWGLTPEGQKQQELQALHGATARWYEKEFVRPCGARVSVRCKAWSPREGVFAALVEPAAEGSGEEGEAGRQLRLQNELLLDLARSELIDQGELGPALAKITEVAARGLSVARASVWRYDEAKSRIICDDLFEQEAGRHGAGLELRALDFPGYFAALAEDRAIAADDARAHPATCEFTGSYLVPLGITAMMDAPIRLGGKLIGVLCHEHIGGVRRWRPEELAFAGSLADVVARALEASERRRAEEALQRANDELELRVAERTQELKEAMEALWGEMELARRIQTALVPRERSLHDFDLFAHSAPAAQVGGDYLDILDTGEQGWLLIGDASGHGVPAGLVMMMCQTAVRALLAAQPCLDPRSLLIAVNRVLTANIERLGEERYMTISAFRHQGGGHFSYAGLHLEPLLFHAATGQVEVLSSRGMWLGLVEDIAEGTESTSLYLAPGDVLLLYSDGVTEAHRDGKLFDLDRLRDTLTRLGHEPVDAIGAGVLAAMDGFTMEDDVTLLIAKRHGQPGAANHGGFHEGELRIEVATDDEVVTARWLGKSQLREAGKALGPFLDELLERLQGRRLVLDFSGLEFMNSSTFVPVTRVVRRAATGRLPLLVRYSPAITWQRAPFEMLRRIVGPASSVIITAER